MGCARYEVARWSGGGWDSAIVSINYDDENYPCLCTLSERNDVGVREIRSMAALGAAVALMHNGLMSNHSTAPLDLPENIVSAIEKYLPDE